MNVLFAINESFSQHCAVCIQSIKSNNPSVKINIVVVAMDLTNNSIVSIESMESENVRITTKNFDAEELDDFPQLSFYSKDIYLRLWVARYFPEEDKVLYLDADTIVVGSLLPLWGVDIGDNVLAAVNIPHFDQHEKRGLPLGSDYFNSGVILFNMDLWRKEDRILQIRNYLIENSERMYCPDQDALNAIFISQKKSLDFKFNAITPFFKKGALQGYISESEVERVRDEVTVVHFNGLARPWLYSTNHPYQKKYIQYLLQTAWANNVPRPSSIVEFLKKKIRQLSGRDSFVSLRQLNGR